MSGSTKDGMCVCVCVCVYIYIVKYYSALKRKELLTYTATWMSLEDIMLGETSQSQKDKYCHGFSYMRYIVSSTS